MRITIHRVLFNALTGTLLALVVQMAPALAGRARPVLAQDCTGLFTIVSVQPGTVYNTAAVNLIVTGTDPGFGDEPVVVVDNYGALNTTKVGERVLNAQLPSGVPPGVYSLRVINKNVECASLKNALTVIGPTDTPEPTDTPAPTKTPAPTGTPGPTAYIRPLVVVESYGASSTVIVPGQDLDFEITLRSVGQSTATNIVATFVAGDFIPRTTGGVHAVGALAPGETSRFFQPLTASSGLSGQNVGTLDVKVTYTDLNGAAYDETFTLSFAVQKTGVTSTATATATATPGLRPQLLIGNYRTDVATLNPGTHFTLTLEVKNVGNANAKRVTMIMGGGTTGGGSEVSSGGTPGASQGGSGGVSGAGGEFANFAPLDSSNVQFLGDLAAGAPLTASQTLVVNGSTKPGAYAVKFSFSYRDDQGSSFTDDQVITLLVYSPPLVEVSFYRETGPITAGQPNQLPLQVANLGRSSVVLGSMRVTAAQGGAQFSNNLTLVGSLDAGGYFTLDATVTPDQPGPLELIVTVGYTDDFNQPQVITDTLEVDVQAAPVEPGGGTGPGGGEGGAEFPSSARESFGQKAWRFVLGMIGLDSGPPAALGPGTPGPGGELPPPGGSETVPAPE